MLLLDAIYINNSGGLVLLRYLLKEIRKRGIDCHFLLDERVRGLNFAPDSESTYLVGSEKNRNAFYKERGAEFSNVLCFGNIPPTIRLKAKVFTFFQNVTLADLPKQVPLKEQPKWLLKRLYIRKLKKNTDGWIVQTSNTASLISRKMGVDRDNINVCPFYDESVFSMIDYTKENAQDYAYIAKAIPIKNHTLLLQGWIALAKLGITPRLHLTIVEYTNNIAELLKEADSIGCKIENHGQCTLEQVKEIYDKCKAVVYTSMNESFGLGMIEAMNRGCDVIGPDMDYVKTICQPSEFFEYKAQALADAVKKYELGESPKTNRLINNDIERFIELITS